MPTPVTVEGAEKLRTELHHRKTKLRSTITKSIAEARAHGDLKENAEYHAAREQQGINEAKIRYLEAMLADARVIDVRKIPRSGKVIFGVTIDMIDVQNNVRVTYRIVGEHEADPDAGAISVTSPIARTLIGKSEGDRVAVKAPGGLLEYEIIQVEHL